MDLGSYLHEIEKNWHGREGQCADCPKWHTGGFKRPFFGASYQDPQEAFNADVVFVGDEPGTENDQAYEEWREDEQISLTEGTDRIAQSDWEFKEYPRPSSGAFNDDELLEIVIGEEPLSESDGVTQFGYYITNVEKCHEPYTNPTDEKYDEESYTGDEVYVSEHDTEKSATDCCFQYLRKEIELIEPQIVVTLGAPAKNKVHGRFSGFGNNPKLKTWPPSVLESNSVDWKLIPVLHPSQVNRRYRAFSKALSDDAAPENDETKAQRVYFDMLREILLDELEL